MKEDWETQPLYIRVDNAEVYTSNNRGEYQVRALVILGGDDESSPINSPGNPYSLVDVEMRILYKADKPYRTKVTLRFRGDKLHSAHAHLSPMDLLTPVTKLLASPSLMKVCDSVQSKEGKLTILTVEGAPGNNGLQVWPLHQSGSVHSRSNEDTASSLRAEALGPPMIEQF